MPAGKHSQEAASTSAVPAPSSSSLPWLLQAQQEFKTLPHRWASHSSLANEMQSRHFCRRQSARAHKLLSACCSSECSELPLIRQPQKAQRGPPQWRSPALLVPFHLSPWPSLLPSAKMLTLVLSCQELSQVKNNNNNNNCHFEPLSIWATNHCYTWERRSWWGRWAPPPVLKSSPWRSQGYLIRKMTQCPLCAATSSCNKAEINASILYLSKSTMVKWHFLEPPPSSHIVISHKTDVRQKKQKKTNLCFFFLLAENFTNHFKHSNIKASKLPENLRTLTRLYLLIAQTLLRHHTHR